MTTDTDQPTSQPEPADSGQPQGQAPDASTAMGSETPDAPDGAGAPGGGRSAEVRELERQADALREQARTAEARAQENLDRWQRAQADLANFRRRTQFEREELEKYAASALVTSLLPVLDNFDRAWSTLPGQFRRLTWLSGVAMVHSQLRGTLERVGLTEIEADGKPFDPSLHEAVDSEGGDGPHHVVAVLQAGYKLNERVLRPTLVKVGPKPEAPAGEAPTAGQEDVSAAPEASGDAGPAGA